MPPDWQRFWDEPGIADRAMLAWRGVEAQHVVSTMRLVDTAVEQDLLEQLLEGSKPALPAQMQAQSQSQMQQQLQDQAQVEYPTKLLYGY